ncbi:hypothetical protein GCM10009764_18130 [Nocardia ninae]|uniref:Uncharacterized protein n=1 Tax=Nocardia ninae NBRC 108245 TaxID=1210091 RepID=A0A511MIT0_9NOCA|nr:hypothetical protein NN4_50520 [Nocardia ninae NBRC 108245]
MGVLTVFMHVLVHSVTSVVRVGFRVRMSVPGTWSVSAVFVTAATELAAGFIRRTHRVTLRVTLSSAMFRAGHVAARRPGSARTVASSR